MDIANRLVNNVTSIDTRLLIAFTTTRYQAQLQRAARMVSKSGDGWMQVLVPSMLLASNPTVGQPVFSAAVLGFALWLPLYWVLKNSFKRRRPPEAIPAYRASIVASDKFSFPSGHTAAAFLLATLCYTLIGSIAWPMFIWASCVGASRVLLGVHFPTDILAGASLGSSMALLAGSIVGSAI